MMRFILVTLFLAAACHTDPAPTTPPIASAPIAVVPPTVSTRTEVDAAQAPVTTDAAVLVDAPIQSTGCSVDADCVLSAAPTGCCSCELEHEQAVLKRALEARESRCATLDCKRPPCPKVEHYEPAFYRAECHTGRCVVVRWHSGG